MEHTIKLAMQNLAHCYQCLSHTADDAASRLRDHSRLFASLVVALEQASPQEFRVKPKLHLFQELNEMQPGARPAKHWTYRDEDFGGSVAGLGRRLGGHKTPKSVGWQVLKKFSARYKLPDFS